MKRVIVGVIVAIAISGCVENRIAGLAADGRPGVFQQIDRQEPVPAGHAELTIVCTLKTMKPGQYFGKNTHGTPEYALLLNIDGQTAWLRGKLTEERMTARELWDPEAGDGVRYSFKSELLLRSGLHKVALALPEDGVLLEKEVKVGEGTYNSLELLPIYRKRKVSRIPGLNDVSTFYEGISGLSAFLDGKKL